MKKSLSLLLVLLLIVSLLTPTIGFAASDTELTVQEKYKALAEKGIFAGIDGDAALDQNMTRAQFARVAALVQGLDGIGNPDTKVVTEKPFRDVELSHWAVEEIAAAKEAGLLNGYADGTFNPSNGITIQELAVVTSKLLGLEPVEGASVDGAADWAAGYIKALKDAGVNLPTNYTEPATRSDLVYVTFLVEPEVKAKKEAEQEENEQKDDEQKETEKKDDEIQPDQPADFVSTPVNTALSIVEAKQVSPKIFTVKFNRKINSSIRIDVSLNDDPVAVQVTSNGEKGYSLTFDDVQEAIYTITAINTDTSKTISTAKVYGVTEKITKIEFIHAADTIAQSKSVVIPFKITNQFGETVQDVSNIEVFTNPSPSYIDPDRNAVIVDTSISTKNDRVSIILMDQDHSVSVTKIYTVGNAPIVSKIEIHGSLRDADGQEVSQANWNQSYVVNFDSYDQYGSLLLPSISSWSDLVTLSISPYSDKISFGTVGAALAGVPGALSLPITLLDSETGGDYTLTITGGGAVSGALTFHVAEPPPKVIPELPESIESASSSMVGQNYYGSVAATGGTGSITYTVVSGQLPPGLTLNSNTGEITGTPSSSGTYSFTISATDSAIIPITETMEYTITIAPQPTLLNLTSDPSNVTLTALGAKKALTITANYNDLSSLDVTSVSQYTSTNESVATVSNTGVVTAVASGTTNISVTYNGVTLNVTVTVDASRQLESIYAYLASNPMRVGTTTNLIITAFFDNETAEDAKSWATIEIENPELVEMDENFYVTALKAGSTKIKVTYLSKEFIIDLTIL